LKIISFYTSSTTLRVFRSLNDCKTFLLSTSETCFVCAESMFIWVFWSHHILTEAHKNFASREFCQFVISMTIITKSVLVEAHWSIDVIKRYHAELRRAYQMIFENLEIVSKEIALHMIVRAINDTVDSDELMFILLIFETYFRMHAMNLSISSITQRAMIIIKTMIEIRKLRIERQMTNVLNIRNHSIVNRFMIYLSIQTY
jgi:hypothetical protein